MIEDIVGIFILDIGDGFEKGLWFCGFMVSFIVLIFFSYYVV